MSARRKLGATRQLSLQTEIRTRSILKKQFSVEEFDDFVQKPPIRPVRLAWVENHPKDSFPVEVKKCKEHKRPMTSKLRHQISGEKDSILFTRQELVERLRQAWKDREENKQNLDIFLTHNVSEIPTRDVDENEGESYNISEKIRNYKSPLAPKVSQNPTVVQRNNVEIEEGRTNLSVTIPGVTQTRKDPEPLKQLPARPLTAAAKRESFQKRANSAFNHTFSVSTPTPTPPLIRTLSIPVKTDNKLKFLASKRRIKPIRKKELSVEEDDDKKGKKPSRCKSAPSGELVTMVSLVSPAASDSEDVCVNKKTEVKIRNTSPVKSGRSPEDNGELKNLAIRKVVKSVKPFRLAPFKNCASRNDRQRQKKVSFQQSSIHTVRSFSASFPARKPMANQQPLLSEREKRAPLEETSPRESRGPKRRLVRAINTQNTQITDSFDDSKNTDPDPASIAICETNVPKNSLQEETNKNNSATKNDEVKQSENEQELEDPDTPKFNTRKEKECWLMFKKMSEKGLPVSYDTILRGMLTPTEYRSARKETNTT